VKGSAIPYSPAERAWVEANKGLVVGELHRAFCERFGRDDVSAGNLNALRKREGWLTGRTGRFEKGQVPANKGVPCPPGKGGRHPNSRKTQFAKGVRLGVAARLHKPIGTERLSKDGYLERKIHDGLPLQSRWRAVHLVEWEALNGPMPKGHALKCLDGNRLNTDPSNWELVPRALLPRLNGGRRGDKPIFDSAPAELKPIILATAKLEHCARTIRKGKRP
jgi:hypothetical protein